MKHHNRRKSPSAVPSAMAPASNHCDAIHRRRVLAVDDNPELRRLISLYLQRHGYEVSLAENGRQAWRMFRRASYDLVITDLQMPVMDGAALMARIKALSPETPVVLITGAIEAAVRDMVNGHGPAQAVLAKPFDFDTLLKTVAALITTEAAAAAITITL
jgi:CheY-like chemotaxis protein